MKLLVVISSLDPVGGGPAEAVQKRSLRLEQMGHTVEVLTLDDPRAGFLQDYPVKFHALGPSHGGYRYNRRLAPWLRAHAQDYDAVLVEGIWQYASFGTWRALRRTRVPYYVSVHGMLDPWFKRRYPLKHLKKWLYWPWAEYRVLRDARAVLFTNESERLLARKSFWLYRADERVVAFGTSTPPNDDPGMRQRFVTAHPEVRGRRVLLFLGRLHEKKGCDLLIQAFALCAANHPALHLVIAGPDQTGWMSHLQGLAEQFGVANRITWPGMVTGEAKWGALYGAEALVLPSHQENFGIVVAEALGCGVPVLISDKVNICREVEADGAGFVESDTLEGTAALLRRWLDLDDESRARMRRQAGKTFTARYGVDAMAESLLQVLGQAAAVRQER